MSIERDKIIDRGQHGMAFNKIILLGNLTGDPEVRTTQSGKSVCMFTVAVGRRMQDKTDFIRCAAWGKTGETISTYLHKGSGILVEGELHIDKYEADAGARYMANVQVDTFSFVGRKNVDDTHRNQDDGDGLPF